MKIMVISDIHANINALLTFKDELQSADYVVCCGDIIGYHTGVNEVIDFLRELPRLHCVLGNHDHYLLRGCPPQLSLHVRQWIEYADQVVRADNRDWLHQLPMTWGGFIANFSFMVVHGSPWDPFVDYLYADSPLLKNLDAFHYDVIAFGQTHRALVRNDKKPFLINPGSIGQSRDKPGLACALLFETDKMEFSKIEKPYATMK